MIENYQNNIWGYDVWSLGITLLEIATGCPVGISKKCMVARIDAKEISTE